MHDVVMPSSTAAVLCMLSTCPLATYTVALVMLSILYTVHCLSEATQSMYVLTQESVSLHCSLFLVYCLNLPHSQSQCPFQLPLRGKLDLVPL